MSSPAETTADAAELEVPFDRYRGRVRDDWLDYNGHLNEAYYLVPFTLASDLWMDAIGLDAAGRAASGRTVYTATAHLRYLREVGAGAPLRVTTQFLDVDRKRLHALARLFRDDESGEELATQQALYLSVDTGNRRVAPWPDSVAARLTAWVAAHRMLPRPAFLGAGIRMP